jgi:hypothetical protein
VRSGRASPSRRACSAGGSRRRGEGTAPGSRSRPLGVRRGGVPRLPKRYCWELSLPVGRATSSGSSRRSPVEPGIEGDRLHCPPRRNDETASPTSGSSSSRSSREISSALSFAARTAASRISCPSGVVCRRSADFRLTRSVVARRPAPSRGFTMARVPLRCPNPRGFPVKAGESYSAPTTRRIRCFQRLCVRNRGCTFCLPCRRSRVRIPSAACPDQAL